MHSEAWMKRHTSYLYDCAKHSEGLQNFNQNTTTYDKAESFKVLPCGKWFLAAYARDVFSRLEFIKSSITSIFGDILKIDSTKNILRKLAGDAKDSASWVTNVGNEHGAILQCMLTASEANVSLQPMADGLTNRFINAKVPSPALLYTD